MTGAAHNRCRVAGLDARGASLCVIRRSPATQRIDSLDVARSGTGWLSNTLWLLSWMGVVLLALVVCVLSMGCIVGPTAARVTVNFHHFLLGALQ